MRLGIIASFGLLFGAIVALGRMSGAQLQHIGSSLLAITLAHGLTVLPWLSTILFAWLWWRMRRRAYILEMIAMGEIEERHRLGAELWEKNRQLERRPAPIRKRATR